MSTDNISIDVGNDDNLLVLRCQRNETIEYICNLQKILSEMKKTGVVLIPNNVSVFAVSQNLQQII